MNIFKYLRWWSTCKFRFGNLATAKEYAEKYEQFNTEDEDKPQGAHS